MDTMLASPIFILSHARTGSTLLRYVIDAHPDVCCPPEIALGRLCHDLCYTIGLTRVEPAISEAARQAAIDAAARSHVDAIMQEYCRAKQKVRWCDKSTHNVEHLGTLARLFPDAHYLCLHRGCMDVVHSLIEMFRFGYPGRYGQLVARSPENVVDAMVDSWIEATERLLDFEAREGRRCLRVTYEDLVATPAPVAARIFAFLDLRFTPSMLEATFTAPHDRGPGDLKVQFSSRIVTNRVGKGAQIPRRNFSESRFRQINVLHQTLGYAPISRDGGSGVEELLRAQGNVSRSLQAEQWG